MPKNEEDRFAIAAALGFGVFMLVFLVFAVPFQSEFNYSASLQRAKETHTARMQRNSEFEKGRRSLCVVYRDWTTRPGAEPAPGMEEYCRDI